MKKTIIILFLLSVVIILPASSETSLNFLTKGQADNLYQAIGDTDEDNFTYDFSYSAYNNFTFNYSHIPAHKNVTIGGGTGTLYLAGDKLE